MKALDLVASRYNQRPSDLIWGGADAFGFDLAVALSSFRKVETDLVNKSLEKTGVEMNPDPLAFFKRMGTKGWNQGKN